MTALTSAQLDRLRFLYGLDPGTLTRAEVTEITGELAAMAALTPAWVEPYVALVERLAPDAPPFDVDPCPQIVDVDVPDMALRRAAWTDGNLHLTTAPQQEDPTRSTSFRLVGAEPRNWDIHGPDGVFLDLSTSGLGIRVPMVAADLELIRGSY